MHRFRAPEWYVPLFLLVLLGGALIYALVPQAEKTVLSEFVPGYEPAPRPAPVKVVDASPSGGRVEE